MDGNQEAETAPKSGRVSGWLFAALLVVAAGFAAWTLAPQTIGETARRQFLCQLQKHYAGHVVSIRRGHFDPDIGLIFEDVRISRPASSVIAMDAREIVRIGRLTVIGDVIPERLLDQENPIVTRRVVIDGVTANVWMDPDGTFAIAGLMPLPKLGPAAPRMELRGVKVRLWGEDPKGRPIDAELSDVAIENVRCGDGKTDHHVTIRGAADFASDFQLKMVAQNNTVDVRMAASGLHYGKSLYDRLPKTWCTVIRHAKELTCTADATLQIFQDASGHVDYRVRARVHEGRFSHPTLPQPITDLYGVVVCDPSGISIEDSHANFGDAFVQATGRVHGHRWPCDADVDLRTQGLLLDSRLASALPSALQLQWAKLDPVGRIDIDAQISHRDQVWHTDADVTCKGVDVRYEKFPYPIEQVVGLIEVRGDTVSTEGVRGRIGGNLMQCAFRMPTKPGLSKEKSFVVATDGPIPIDNTLLRAMSPRGGGQSGLESFVRSLHPRGAVKLAMATFKTDADGNASRTIDLRVIDGHLRYDKFSYPLYNVSGQVRVENSLVQLTGFRATNANAGVILCDGAYRIASPPGVVAKANDSELSLNFRASNVPMDESLRSSLPWSTTQVWDAISPSGVLDELNVLLTQRGTANPLGLDITAKQHEHGQVTNRLLSLRPSALPYRFDVTGGVVHYDGKRVTIDSVKGSHDASKVSADGDCVQGEDGRWVLSLNLHSGSRVNPDGELIAALPPQVRESMRRLQLRGPVNVSGTTKLTMPDQRFPEPTIDWDLELQLEGNRIGDVGPVHSLRGEISVQGTRNERILEARGEVRIDSMHAEDLQITNIRGPFSIDGDRLYLGGKSTSRRVSGAPQGQNVAPSIQGKLFDGTIDLDGELVLTSGGFDVGIALKNAQLPTLLADFGHVGNEWTGTLTGQTKLQGNLGTNDVLRGNGAARVSGANLYQLPLIVQVLNQLRITPTEDVAFTDGEIEFSLYGDTVTFNDLQIWGDLISLQGGGTMNRRQELDLTFNTRVSPQNTFTRIIRPLRSQKYTLFTIDVRGPLSAPEIERRALDGVGETLERLFPAFESSQPPRETVPRSASVLGGWSR